MRTKHLQSICLLLLAPVLALGAIDHGEWTLSRSELGNKVYLSLHGGDGRHSMNMSSDWNPDDLKGLDWGTAGKHDVQFSIARDAGTIYGEGFLKDGSGAGLFTFHANQRIYATWRGWGSGESMTRSYLLSRFTT